MTAPKFRTPPPVSYAAQAGESQLANEKRFRAMVEQEVERIRRQLAELYGYVDAKKDEWGDHTFLSGRDQPDQHPQSAISDLVADQAAQDQALADHEADESDPHNTLKPWGVDATTGDLYPDTIVPGDAGIGTIEKAVAHVALGTQENVGTSGIEGAILDNSDANGGGLMLIGIRDVDPQNPPNPLVENAPVRIFGNPVIIGSQIAIEVALPISEDHEVILGPSTTTSSGRHFAPLMLGPKKVYSQAQDAQDVADHDVLDLGEVEIVSMTLTDGYVVGATMAFQVYLDNPGNKETTFRIILKRNGVEATRYTRRFTSNGSLVSDSAPIANAFDVGDVLSLDVDATSSHSNSEGWVRGTIQATVIRLQQG